MKVLSAEDLRCPISGKHAYTDEASAREMMARSWQRPNERRRRCAMPFRAYLCECGWWHLSSQEKRT